MQMQKGRLAVLVDIQVVLQLDLKFNLIKKMTFLIPDRQTDK